MNPRRGSSVRRSEAARAATAAVSAAFVLASWAQAQPASQPPAPPAQTSPSGTDADRLRRENEDLKRRVQDLEARIQALTEENDRLRAAVGGPRDKSKDKDKSKGKGPATPAPAGPTSSPDGLFAALTEDYQKALSALPRSSPREQARYQSEVQQWIRQVPARFRGPVEWTILLTELKPPQRAGAPTTIVFAVADPTGMAISELVSCPVPPRFFKAVQEAKLPGAWTLSGTINAKPTYNATRAEAGADPTAPRFVGPFAEFGFDLVVTNLTPQPTPTP